MFTFSTTSCEPVDKEGNRFVPPQSQGNGRSTNTDFHQAQITVLNDFADVYRLESTTMRFTEGGNLTIEIYAHIYQQVTVTKNFVSELPCYSAINKFGMPVLIILRPEYSTVMKHLSQKELIEHLDHEVIDLTGEFDLLEKVSDGPWVMYRDFDKMYRINTGPLQYASIDAALKFGLANTSLMPENVCFVVELCNGMVLHAYTHNKDSLVTDGGLICQHDSGYRWTDETGSIKVDFKLNSIKRIYQVGDWASNDAPPANTPIGKEWVSLE